MATPQGKEDPRAVRIAIEAEPAHLNPILDPDLWGYRIAHDLICEPLIRRRADAREGAEGVRSYEGVLAQTFSLDADGTGATFVLHKGIRFHDGKALTAHDVRFTLERLSESRRIAPRTQVLVSDLWRIEVSSREHLHVQLRRPSGQLLARLAEIDILPEHLFSQGNLLYQPHNRHPVCSGPYRLHEWRRGVAVVLRRNPGYWGTDAGLSPGAAEELIFQIIPDRSRALSLLRRGGVDFLPSVPAVYVPDQVDPAALHGNLRKLEVPADQVVALLWNMHHPVLALPRVRQALSLLIDRQRLVHDVRHDLAEPLVLPPPLQAPSARGDAASAEALLDEAGIRRQTDGGLRYQGNRPVSVRVLVPAGSSESLAVVRRIAEAAARAGLTLEPEVVDLATLQGRLRRASFDAALVAWAWTGHAPDLSPLLHRGGAQAFSGGESAEMDAALDALRRALEPAFRGAAEARIAALLRDEEPVTFLYRPHQLMLLSGKVMPQDMPLRGDFVLLRSLYLRGSP